MTDKELIKQKIEKLHELLPVMDGDNVSINYAERICTALETYIDSLPKEPASEGLIEEIDKIWKTCNPIDEGMGVETANIHIEQFDDIARHFAEWQKNKMKEAMQTEYEKGRFDMREEMMKDAVEGTVKYEIGSAEIPQCDRRYQVLSDPTPIANAKLGDKVKIIIVKEK